ncbi:MAG: cytochrome c maturation protein CcmE [Armatimonadetes bacterium]|nr:cytochrome c maturation protein CcmE [Armatimonadota bacterium]PIU64672.1 MAG: hypothetical protein COS85_11630 [Armatimonadetes bacterium CG07_land_8_20_14_0_80_59_28]PIX40325.1 MAG: hypothetical protein COZ56_15055 [Armatimonadetes bacterium CG_4_8_14_3_um_filter_58_9]PIY40724.1 MAG: hypothetical protein COZ05_16925 [Armatimonadetes bacterium CG_4_10_14_3_um_filter_59_10]PJB62409.1 MAG: hypothetical protein CO095_18520 [Armatimonadetes bacterium CG_4_9_14_3_um_filter_58_7]
MKGKKRLQVTLGMVIIVLALAALIYDTTRSSAMRYMEVAEVAIGMPELQGKGLRVRGRVQKGSINKSREDLKVQFNIEDKTGTISYPVVYTGLPPDTFKDGSEVVVDGRFSSEGVFEAVQIQAKCPSKYEMEDQAGSTSAPEGHDPVTPSQQP